MSFKVEILFVFVTCYTILSNTKALRISDKLDLESASQHHHLQSAKITSLKVPRNAVRIVNFPAEIGKNLSCDSTGCNGTASNDDGTFQAQVLVQVHTKVNLNQSGTNKSTEDAQDVPIIAGNKENHYSNGKYEDNEDRPIINCHSSPCFPESHRNSYENYDSASRPPQESFKQYYNEFRGNNFEGSVHRSASNFNNVPSVPIINQFRNLNAYNDYNPRTEIPFPYLGHSQNEHYFHEQPPSYTMTYQRNRNPHNPVEFRAIPRNQWRPAFWTNKYSFGNNDQRNFPNSHHSTSYSHNLANQFPAELRRDNTACLCRRETNYNQFPSSEIENRPAINDKLSRSFK